LLENIHEYKKKNDNEIFNACVEHGVSSNFCHAISEISLNGQSDVVIDIEYYNGIDKEIDTRNILIKKEFIPIIDTIRQYFRSDLTEEGYEIKGYVTMLHREQDDEKREVTVAAWVDGRPRKIRMALTSEHYTIALEAHKENAMLICIGTLSIRDRITKLLNVTNVVMESES
jgi:hypothetical protein